MFQLVSLLNTSKAFSALALIMMNIGSKYVMTDINFIHERVLASELTKTIVLFCMFFVGSRDIITAMCLTFAFSVVIKGLSNPKSRFNILPQSLVQQLLLNDPEYKKAKAIVQKYEEFVNVDHFKNDVYDSYKERIDEIGKLKHNLI